MTQYWDDLITKQSWLKLQQINKKYKFVLIGGWAVFVFTKASEFDFNQD